MKEFIKQKLRENLTIPSMALYKNIEVPNEIRNEIKSINWSDIQLEPQGEVSPVTIKVTLPTSIDVSEGIALDIELVAGDFYQIHLSIAEGLRGLGLGYKIHQAVIHNFGHIYSGKGRIHNQNEIPRIWDKLANESDISCKKSDIATICVSSHAENKDELLNNF